MDRYPIKCRSCVTCTGQVFLKLYFERNSWILFRTAEYALWLDGAKEQWSILFSFQFKFPRCGQVRRGVGCGSACGAKRLNLPTVNEIRSRFCFVGMCDALMQMFDFRQINMSLRIRFIILSDLGVDWLITWTNYILSIWNKSLEFANWLCRNIRATTTGKGSRKVISLIMPCSAQGIGQKPCAHFPSK